MINKIIENIDKIDPKLLDFFIKEAKDNYYRDHTIQKCLLVKINDLYGVLYISPAGELLDSHCKHCQNEPPCFFRFAKDKNMPGILHADIGMTKYQKLIDGKMSFYQENMEILFDLLEL